MLDISSSLRVELLCLNFIKMECSISKELKCSFVIPFSYDKNYQLVKPLVYRRRESVCYIIYTDPKTGIHFLIEASHHLKPMEPESSLGVH